MMKNFAGEAQLRVLVLQCVKTVRASGQYFFDVVIPECLDVCLSEDLVEILVTDSPGGIAAASLLHPQDGKLHTQMIQDLDHGQSDFFIPVIERPDTPYKEQVVDLFLLEL
jgi:hypothetical protein